MYVYVHCEHGLECPCSQTLPTMSKNPKCMNFLKIQRINLDLHPLGFTSTKTYRYIMRFDL